MLPKARTKQSTRKCKQRCSLFVSVCLVIAIVIIFQIFMGDTETANYSLRDIGRIHNQTSLLHDTLLDTKVESLKLGNSNNNNVDNTCASYDPNTGQIFNLNVVLVGDSLSRYMYLSLVHWVHTKKWVSEGDELLEKVKDKSPEAWNGWLAYTNKRFAGYEDCDCYRYWQDPFKWYKHCENRYYRDPRHNNSITFITKFGGNPFHGHWLPGVDLARDLQEVRHDSPMDPRRLGLNQTLRKYTWSYSTWDGLVHEYIAKLNPKPNIFLFNQGHWKAHELRDPTVVENLATALRLEGIRGIYRTTTFRSDEPNYHEYAKDSTRKHDSAVCAAPTLDCLNVSWTAFTPAEDYIDPVHFKAPITNQMTYQFLTESLGIQPVKPPPVGRL